MIEAMATGNAAADVQEVLSSIREFIQHPRRLDPLIKDQPKWNMLASAMDVISDTESAVLSYERGVYSDKGTLYLVLFGLFQAMYVQQDALENLVRALGDDQYRIGEESEAEFIRQVRHDTVGHPTKQGGTKPRKDGKPGEQVSHAIIQHSLSKERFTLLRESNLTDSQFMHYQTQELIARNRALVLRVLARTKKKLEDIEMEHRSAFKGEKLASFFPSTMDYYFEKILQGIHNPSYGREPMGEIGLEMIVGAFAGFKAALRKRGILNEQNHIRYWIDEVEYPLVELGHYFKGAGLLTDPRAASIFAHFARDKMHALLQIAEEIDAEYESDLAAGDDNPDHVVENRINESGTA